MKLGDFSNLAENYSKYRQGYSPSVLTAALSLVEKPFNEIDAADVGAGTGIFTRMLAERSLRSITAVEPNDAMREAGERSSAGSGITWRAGEGAATGLEASSFDLVTMASSFHWVDFDAGTAEFARILRPGGRFCALWNPRLVEANPILREIEDHLNALLGDTKRVSSGRSGITDTLTEKLEQHPKFEDTVFMEGRHIVEISHDAYMGAWRSVNDVQVRLGDAGFRAFLEYVEAKISALKAIEATYLTRLWTARRA